MPENYPAYYGILTANIRYSKKLSMSEKVMFTEITALSNANGYCSARNKYFAELYEKSEKTISLWLKNLKDCGFIRIEYKRRGAEVISRKIYPTPEHELQKCNSTDYKNVNRTDYKNVKENNTSINNTSINNNTTNASVDEISSIGSPSNQDKVLGCGSVYEFYEKNIGMTSPYIREDIQYEFDDWMQINESEASQIIIEALKIAVEAQASNKWRYAKSILKSWEEKNIKSLKDIEADDAQHRRKMDSRFNNRKPREEKMPDWVNEQPQDDQQEASPEDMAEIQRLLDKINQKDEED